MRKVNVVRTIPVVQTIGSSDDRKAGVQMEGLFWSTARPQRFCATFPTANPPETAPGRSDLYLNMAPLPVHALFSLWAFVRDDRAAVWMLYAESVARQSPGSLGFAMKPRLGGRFRYRRGGFIADGLL